MNLKEDIWSIFKILLNSKENFLYSRYLHIPETKEEVEYLKSSRHFHFIRHSLWRLSIIELHKLTTNSTADSYSLWAFLKNLENNIYDNHKIPINKIKEWRIQLNSKKNILDKIKLLRNKIYAHTDPDKDELEIDISFKEVEEIILFIETVVRDIYRSLDITFLTETPLFETEGFDLIKTLADEEKRRIQEILSWRKTP